MKKGKRILSIVFSLVFICVQFSSVYASSIYLDPLKVYKDRLMELNEELGTNYAICSDGTLSDKELEEFYQKMSMAEFDEYIYSLYQLDMENPVQEMTEDKVMEQFGTLDLASLNSAKEMEEESACSDFTTYDSSKKQKYYYTGFKPHCFTVDFATGVNSNGKKCYTGIRGMSYYSAAYPYYTIEGYAGSFKKNYRQANIAFQSFKYLSPGLIDTGIHYLDCIFKIYGVHVYASTTV